jgi:hypothetical protein
MHVVSEICGDHHVWLEMQDLRVGVSWDLILLWNSCVGLAPYQGLGWTNQMSCRGVSQPRLRPLLI